MVHLIFFLVRQLRRIDLFQIINYFPVQSRQRKTKKTKKQKIPRFNLLYFKRLFAIQQCTSKPTDLFCSIESSQNFDNLCDFFIFQLLFYFNLFHSNFIISKAKVLKQIIFDCYLCFFANVVNKFCNIFVLSSCG